jgi:hypothetical protein
MKSSRAAISMALGIIVLGYVPQAHANFVPTMFLCMSSTQSGCETGTDPYMEVFSDGLPGDIAFAASATVSGATASNGPGTNRVTASAQIGSFHINTSVGLLNATPTQALDLSWNDTTSGAGTLWVSWGAIGFTSGSPFSGSANGNFSGAITSVQAFGCIVDTNSLATLPLVPGGPTVPPIPNSKPLPGCVNRAAPLPAVEGSAASAIATTSPINLTLTTGLASQSPFTLEEQIKIVSGSGAGQTSGDYSLSPNVPEPASVTLLGSVLLVAFGAIRRKQRRV